MKHPNPSESMPVVAAGGMAVLRNGGHRTARAGVTRAGQAWKGVLAFVHRRISAVDIWLQDHHTAVIIGALILIFSAVASLLNYRMEEVIEYARPFAPVLSVFSVIVTAVFKTLKWFRKRRRARLVARRAGVHGGRPPARGVVRPRLASMAGGRQLAA